MANLKTLWLMSAFAVVSAKPFTKSATGYVETYNGTLNVILAAPHGGSLNPSSIPDRTAGCWNIISGTCTWTQECTPKDTQNCGVTTSADLYTSELTLALRDELTRLFGRSPPTVLNLLHRRKLDANRDIGEAAVGDPVGEEAWWEFQNFINASRAEIAATAPNGMGLFIDIHGHAHSQVWAELGYLISASSLNSGIFNPSTTSIRHLASYVQIPFEQLLRGDTSFGFYLQLEGFEAVPSPVNLSPGSSSYFSGGYNTRTHGSVASGNVDAIQIESPRAYRDPPMRDLYAIGLANAIYEFMSAHYPVSK